MKKFLCVLLVLGLAACATPGESKSELKTKADIIQGLTNALETMNLAITTTESSLRTGLITWQQACKVDQYVSLGKALAVEAKLAVEAGDLVTAEGKLQAAASAAAGIGNIAQKLVEDNCAGERTSWVPSWEYAV